jgi:AraC-like DNA-binding protein
MDVLSNVLNAVQLTGAVFFDVEAFSPWVAVTPKADRFRAAVMPDAEHIISFHIILAGSCWAEMPDSVPATLLTAGDLVVIPLGDEHVMSSAPGLRGEPNLNTYSRAAYRRLPAPFVLNQGGGPERSHFVCGYFGCTRRPFNPLLDALPRMFHASVSPFSREWMLSLVRAAAVESEDKAAGGDTMLAKIAELMFVEVVRKYIRGLPEDARGWFSALRDPQIGAGITLMHDRPAEAWTVEALARAVGMSRSMFAERFVELIGVPPMHYLSKWRLQLAASLLTRTAISISAVAAEVGYESETAFNRMFKKVMGIPPAAWRKRNQSAVMRVSS